MHRLLTTSVLFLLVGWLGSANSRAQGNLRGGATFTEGRPGVTGRLLSATSTSNRVDEVFGPFVGPPVTGLAVQSDGAILLLTNEAGPLTRLSPHGRLDMNYRSSVTNLCNPFLVGAFDRVLAATQDPVVFSTNGLVRLLADGSPDPSFRPAFGVEGRIMVLAEMPDRSILLGGTFFRVNGQARATFTRLLENGELDPGFGFIPDPKGIVDAIAVQPDGKILIGGRFSSVNRTARRNLARLLPDGSLDPVFFAAPNSGTLQDVLALALVPGGKVLVGGPFTNFNNQPSGYLVRLDPQGNLDPTFHSPTSLVTTQQSITPAIDQKIHVQRNGKILVRGAFTRINDAARPGLAQMFPDGGLDVGFDPGNVIAAGGRPGFINAASFAADGQILIGGEFVQFGGLNVTNLALLFADLPAFAAPRIQSIQLSPLQQLTLDFILSAPGRYALEKSEDLRTWREVAVSPPLSSEAELTDAESIQPRQFYRIVGPK